MRKEIKKVPTIRFRGFTEDWEQRKLSELAKNTYGGGTPKTSVIDYWNGDIPWIQSSDLQDEQLFDVEPKKRISNDAIIHSATKLIPGRSIAIVTRVGVGKLAYMPYEYTTSQDFLSLSELKINPEFSVYILYNLLKRLSVAVQGTSIKGLTKDDLLKEAILVPHDSAEQKKIGAYLHKLDNLITLHQRKFDQLKTAKTYFLQNMFPAKGEKVPRIRFHGFTGDWEQRKLGEITKANSFKQYIAEGTLDGTYEVIQQGDTPVVGYADGKPFEDYENVSLFGDHTLSLYKPKSPFFIASDGIKILSPSISINGLFYYYLLMRYKPHSEGYKRHYTILKSCEALYPTECEEQKKIGEYFANLDNLITLHQHKLDQLKTLKKFMLQNLFI